MHKARFINTQPNVCYKWKYSSQCSKLLVLHTYTWIYLACDSGKWRIRLWRVAWITQIWLTFNTLASHLLIFHHCARDARPFIILFANKIEVHWRTRRAALDYTTNSVRIVSQYKAQHFVKATQRSAEINKSTFMLTSVLLARFYLRTR